MISATKALDSYATAVQNGSPTAVDAACCKFSHYLVVVDRVTDKWSSEETHKDVYVPLKTHIMSLPLSSMQKERVLDILNAYNW